MNQGTFLHKFDLNKYDRSDLILLSLPLVKADMHTVITPKSNFY